MTPDQSASVSRSRYSRIFTVLFLGFVVSGVVGTLNGPILPSFIARWNLDDARAGLFFTVFYIGSLGGTLASSVALASGKYKPTLALGYALAAVGIAVLNAPSHALALVATFIYGAGYGLLVPSTNLWVAEYSGKKRAAALNLLNLAWGLGAIFCPILVLYAVHTEHFSLFLFGVATAALVICVGQLVSPYDSHEKSRAEIDESGSAPAPGVSVIAGLAFLFFVYVGVENAISGWAAAHAKRVLPAGDPAWAMAPMLFFVGLLSGRAVSSLILLRVKETTVVYSGLALAALGNLIFLRATTKPVLLVSACAAGLGCSGVYPIFVAWLAKWFGTKARKIGGVMFSLAALGGASLPWMVGLVSNLSASLRVGLVVPLAGIVAMLAVIAFLTARERA